MIKIITNNKNPRHETIWSLRIEYSDVEILHWSGGGASVYLINKPMKYIENGVVVDEYHNKAILNGNMLEFHRQYRFSLEKEIEFDLTNEEVELVKKAMTEPLKSEYKSNSEINEPIDTTSWKQGGK